MRLLKWLNDRIVESHTHIPLDAFLIPVSVFSQNIWDLLSLWSDLSKLEVHSETTFNIVDFDDTLFSRYEQLQRNEFQDNRGEEGNKFLREEFGFRKFIEEFYSRSRAVKRILWVVEWQTEKHRSLILTAGMQDLQELKVQSLDISRETVPVVTVDSSHKKPLKMIQYIIKTLGFVPWKIIIYEDRPECFQWEMSALRQLLPRTEIVIDKVVLNPAWSLRQIKSIHQSIYQVSWKK